MSGAKGGRPFAPADCKRCTDASCEQCETYARMFLLAMRRALVMPSFRRRLMRVGVELSEGRIVGTGMHAKRDTQTLLFELHNALKHHIRVEGEADE